MNPQIANDLYTHPHTTRAFTLVELSIVLVILGLLVGGVLSGQSLIRASQLRSVNLQLDDISRAALTFRDKYVALPGDIPASTANALGLVTRSGADTYGDGDGLIENPIPWSGIVGGIGRETSFFWADLTKTGLLSGSFPAISAAAIPQGNLATASDYDNYMPASKLGLGAHFHIGNQAGRHYIVLGRPRGYNASFGGVFYMNAVLTPEESYNIDTKTDDGKPDAGKMIFGNAPQIDAGSPVALPDGCLDASGAFNTAKPYGSNVTCALFVQASF